MLSYYDINKFDANNFNVNVGIQPLNCQAENVSILWRIMEIEEGETSEISAFLFSQRKQLNLVPWSSRWKVH